MSKYTLATKVSRELKKINREIDLKILRGESYRREARRHKSLLSLRKSFSLISIF